MKRFVLALVMACALSATAVAGDIHSTDSPAPPPPSSVVTTVIIAIVSLVAG